MKIYFQNLLFRDNLLDYFPKRSTFSNLFDLFLKHANPTNCSNNLKNNKSFKYIRENEGLKSIILLVPIFVSICIITYGIKKYLDSKNKQVDLGNREQAVTSTLSR